MGLVLLADMDAFYASCELLRHPELRGRPFIVGTADDANKTRGVVETCSYEAKRLGVHSAMAVAAAMKIDGSIAYLQADHSYYEEVSADVMGLLRGYGFRAEVISVDEAALDLGDMTAANAEELGRRIKSDIANKIGIPCTVGISTGKVFAKIVCDSAKPNGLMLVGGGQIKDFLAGMDVKRIPGVGSKTAERLGELGIKTVADLARADVHALMDKVGSFGTELHNLANGTDQSKIVEQYKVLSIGRERTLESRTISTADIDKMIDLLADEVIGALDKQGVRFKTVTVKARYYDFTERVKGRSLSSYSSDPGVLKSTAKSLIRELLGSKPVRKVGVRVSSLDDGKGQARLF